MDVLGDWLAPLFDAPTMRGIDSWAIEKQRVASLELMERAGQAVVRAVEELAPDGPVAVVCGKGNNGGDGLVAARLLRDGGRDVRVVCALSPDEFSGDARENLTRLPGREPLRLDGIPWRGQPDSASHRQTTGEGPLEDAAVIVDAVLGTGFSGEPAGPAAQAIEAINAARAPVVSVDVPSGVDASTGVIAGVAVGASMTVSFHAGKPGLWIRPGKGRAGALRVVDIGIPRGAPARADVGLITPAVLELLPRRGADSTKFVSGHVLVAGGSRGLSGAVRLAGAASMRAGAGYVTACVPASLQSAIAAGDRPELMTRALPEDDGSLREDGVGAVLGDLARGGTLALGPGLGREEGAFAFARALARDADAALVLDADGLNAHAGALATLARRRAPTVLTPHAGELARLLGIESSQIERERLRHVRAAASEADAVVLLKGDDTLIADPAGRTAVSPGASPALATAGTGDVLTGVIAALLAAGLAPFEAASAGVWLHAAAGRLAAERVGSPEGVVASDVIAALGAVRHGESTFESDLR